MTDEKSYGAKASGDTILQLLVDMVNADQLPNIPVTLNVGGLLVSGYLVSVRNYFVQLMETLSGGGSGSKPDFATLWETTPAAAQVREPKWDKHEPSARFVHLRNAVIFYPGGGPSVTAGEGILWRGRVDAVDGFMLGMPSPPQAPIVGD